MIPRCKLQWLGGTTFATSLVFSDQAEAEFREPEQRSTLTVDTLLTALDFVLPETDPGRRSGSGQAKASRHDDAFRLFTLTDADETFPRPS